MSVEQQQAPPQQRSFYRHSPYASFGSASPSEMRSPMQCAAVPSAALGHPSTQGHGYLGGTSLSPAGPAVSTPTSQHLSGSFRNRSTHSSNNGSFAEEDHANPNPSLSLGGTQPQKSPKSPKPRRNGSRKFNLLSAGGGSEHDGGASAESSNASSVTEHLPLCADDVNCPNINDRQHQKRFAHTCRLFPCYHGHVPRHAKLFRHKPGQLATTAPADPNPSGKGKHRPMALASVTFAAISPDAPNATRLTVAHRERAFDIFGDWPQVKVHTLKRYLHQVFAVEPQHQTLRSGSGRPMDDELEAVSAYLTDCDSVVVESPSPDALRGAYSSSSAAGSASPKFDVSALRAQLQADL